MRQLKRQEDGTTVDELNRLEILNLNEFFSDYGNNRSYYATPFGILHELENQVVGEDYPEEQILIEYKEDGYQEFSLVEIKEVGIHRVVVYQHTGGIS